MSIYIDKDTKVLVQGITGSVPLMKYSILNLENRAK